MKKMKIQEHSNKSRKRRKSVEEVSERYYKMPVCAGTATAMAPCTGAAKGESVRWTVSDVWNCRSCEKKDWMKNKSGKKKWGKTALMNIGENREGEPKGNRRIRGSKSKNKSTQLNK